MDACGGVLFWYIIEKHIVVLSCDKKIVFRCKYLGILTKMCWPFNFTTLKVPTLLEPVLAIVVAQDLVNTFALKLHYWLLFCNDILF